MKLHALMLIKNEGDFIERSLRYSSRCFDHIYVLDNGSSDRTWQIVTELADSIPQIVPFKSDPRAYEGYLRGEIYNAYADRAQRGDWWCQLDGDEVYPEHPAAFLGAIPESHHVVWSLHQNFYATEADVERWARGVSAPCDDFSDLPRHYLVNHSVLSRGGSDIGLGYAGNRATAFPSTWASCIRAGCWCVTINTDRQRRFSGASILDGKPWHVVVSTSNTGRRRFGGMR